jgi:hypothetical protein
MEGIKRQAGYRRGVSAQHSIEQATIASGARAASGSEIPQRPLDAHAPWQGTRFDPWSPFDKSEFPNLIARVAGTTVIPSGARGRSRARRQLERAMGALCARMELPLREDDRTVRMRPYLKALDRELAHRGVKANVFIPIRNLLRAIYAQLEEQVGRNPPIPPHVALAAMIKKRTPVSGFDLKGFSSDWDVWIRSEEEGRALDVVSDVSSAAFQRFGLDAIISARSRVFYFAPDCSSIDAMWKTWVPQGGSPLDWLAFDVAEQKIVAPSGYDFVIDQLIEGRWTFIEPTGNPKDSADTALRAAARVALELPWLQLSNPEALLGALEKAKPNRAISKLALGQGKKAAVNALCEGAHDRFRRAPAGSIDSQLVHAMERLASCSIDELVPRRLPILPLGRDAAQLPKGVLFDWPDDPSAKRRLYRVARDFNEAYPLAAGAFLMSVEDGHGPVFRCTPDRDRAGIDTPSGGLVVPIALSRDARIKILDWAAAEREGFAGLVTERARLAGRSTFEVLARDYGIDLVHASGDIFVLNAAALDHEPGAAHLAGAYAETILASRCPLSAKLPAFVWYQRNAEYLSTLKTKPVAAAELELAIVETYRATMACALDGAGPDQQRMDAISVIDAAEAWLVSMGIDVPRIDANALAQASPIQGAHGLDWDIERLKIVASRACDPALRDRLCSSILGQIEGAPKDLQLQISQDLLMLPVLAAPWAATFMERIGDIYRRRIAETIRDSVTTAAVAVGSSTETRASPSTRSKH